MDGEPKLGKSENWPIFLGDRTGVLILVVGTGVVVR